MKKNESFEERNGHMKNMPRGVKVVQPDPAFPLEVMAEHIAELSRVGKKLQESRLKQHTIVLLLQDMTKLTRSQIVCVLNALPELEKQFLKPKIK